MQKFRGGKNVCRTRLLIRVAAGALACTMASYPAQAVAQSASANIDIPAQPLAQSLMQLSRQTNVNIVADSSLTRNRRAPAVRGAMSVEQALNRLLAQSGLSYRANGRSFIVERREANPASGEGQAGSAAADDESAAGTPEILVTGRPSLNADIRRSRDAAQPYQVYTRETIERSGANNLDTFFRQYVPSSATTESPIQVPGSTRANSSAVNLRGLGPNQTLILIDGRRTAAFAIGGLPQQPDINNIPISAIERVEILPSTASGIYGGGATGGVVNIVLRRDYTGLEARIGYGNTFTGDAERRAISVTGGFSPGPDTNVMISASYSGGDGLSVGDRDYLRRGRALLLANNPAALIGLTTPPVGATPNIRSVSGANLVLRTGGVLNSPFTFVPAGYAGPSTDGGAALLANAGRYNLNGANSAQAGAGDRQSLLSEPLTAAASITIRQRISDSLRAFLEVRGSTNESSALVNQANTTFQIAANAPNNPFTEAVTVTVPGVGADRTTTSRIETLAFTGGLIADLGSGWRSEVDASRQWTRYGSSFPAGLTAAGTTAVTSGQIDVFRDFAVSGATLYPYVNNPTVVDDVTGTLTSVTARIAGPAIRLPGGPIMVTALAEYRREGLQDFVEVSQTGQTYYPSRSQSARSAYIEAVVPLFSDENRRPGLELLELQLAGRYDSYTTNGVTGSIPVGSTTPIVRTRASFDSVNPTVGLRYKPVPDIMFRASYGTGFLPPTVNQLVSNPTSSFPAFLVPILNLRDPARGNELLPGFTFQVGGNPNLKPEESRSYSAGVVLTPTFIPNLRASVDWTRIDKTNNISFLPVSSDTIATLNSFAPGRITRAAPAPNDPYGVGVITNIDFTQINLAETHVRSWDFALDYQFDIASLGMVKLFGVATHQASFRSKVTAAAAPSEFAGTNSNLDWRGTAGVSLESGPFMVQLVGRYYSGYWLNVAHTVNANQGSARIGAQTYFDFYGRYAIGPRTDLSLSVVNLFNRSPPIDTTNSNGVFYSAIGDPRRAYFLLELRQRF